MFSSQINKCQDKLTGTEQVIAKYLSQKYSGGKDNKMMSSEQIARNVGCGQATVVRFAQKLGYSSFKNMMLDLINESFFMGEGDYQLEEDVRQTASKLQYQYEQSIIEVMKQNTDEEINNAVNILSNARQIICYGIRTSSSMVSILYYRLMETGCNTIYSENYQYAASFVYNMNSSDVLFMVSVSGQTEETMKLAEIAHKRGGKVITITGSKGNELAKISDIGLKSAEYDVHTNKFNLVNRTSELFLIDLLFIRLWRTNESKMIKRTEAFSNEINTLSSRDVLLNGTYRL